MTGFWQKWIPSANEPSESWFTRSRFAWMLALGFIAAFPEIIFGAKTFVVRDYGYFGFPLALYHRETFWNGEIPLWNPLSMCGVPFLAQWNTLVCYPLSLFYLVFPLTWSLPMFCLGHLFIGGLGMHALAERWTGNRFGAAFAGTAFAFSGLSMNFLMWPNNSAALGWMPWVILFAERAIREGKKPLLMAVLIGSLQMLTGAPEIILLTWLVAGGVAIGNLVAGGKARKAIVARFGLIVVWVTVICAIQLLPFFELVQVSYRDTNYFEANKWPIPGVGWAAFLVPLFYTFPSPQGVYFQYDQYWTTSYYVGIGTILFCGVALWRSRRKRVLFLAIVALAGAMLALGDQGGVYPLLRKLVPSVGSFRYPSKFIVLTVFALPLLAAFAWDFYLRRQAGPRRFELGLAVVMIAFVTGIIWFAQANPMPNDVAGVTEKSGLTRTAFLVALLGLCVIVPRLTTEPKRGGVLLLVLATLWLDLFTHTPAQNLRVEAGIFQPGLVRDKFNFSPMPKHGETRLMLHPYANLKLFTPSTLKPQDDYVINRLAFFANCNLLDGIPKVNGFYSLYVKESVLLIDSIYGSTRTPHAPLLDFLGVSQMTKPGDDVFAWEPRATALPLVTAGAAPVLVTPGEALRAVLSSNFNPRAHVYLQDDVGKLPPARVEVRSPQAASHQVKASVTADTPTVLTIAQTWHPRWKAYVDGAPVPLLKANFAFQALVVPAGQHEVLVKYEDKAFWFGAVLSAIGFIAWIVQFRRR